MTNSNKPHMTMPNGDVIHEGGYGVTRDGRKVGPMRLIPKDWGYGYTHWKWTDLEFEPSSAEQKAHIWDNFGSAGILRHWVAYEIIAAWVDDTKPARDQNRPRPAHKLNLQKGDVVRHVGWEQGPSYAGGAAITVGGDGVNGWWLQRNIDTPLPKGERPLFVVVSHSKPTLPTDTRNRLAFAENAMLEDGMTPAQIRDHMRRHADVIDGQICGMEGDA